MREIEVLGLVVEACAAPERVRRPLRFALADVRAVLHQLEDERGRLEAERARLADELEDLRTYVVAADAALRELRRMGEDARAEAGALRRSLANSERALDDAAEALGVQVGA